MIKTCAHCGKQLDRKDINYRKKKYCDQVCMGQSFKMTPDRFWAKVDKGPHPKGCWLYTGYRQKFGHGWMGKHGLAHRYSWELANGKIPAGLFVCHHCDVPACVNPAHLFIGDRMANVRDSVTKRRHPFGERSPKALLTEADVLEIQRTYKFTRGGRKGGQTNSGELAEKYGVSRGAILAVVAGRSWKHLKE